jgi:hypothetical protein
MLERAVASNRDNAKYEKKRDTKDEVKLGGGGGEGSIIAGRCKINRWILTFLNLKNPPCFEFLQPPIALESTPVSDVRVILYKLSIKLHILI